MSYKHFDADKTRFASPAQPSDEAANKKPGLLKDVSISQILATSLAAVTAFVLSNQIGIAGSIIGVAVGAAASALATQIYQNVIRRSTHKFRSSDNNEYSQQAYSNSNQNALEGTQYMPQPHYAPAHDYYPNATSRTRQSSQVNRTQKVSHKRANTLIAVTIISIIFTISAVILYAIFLNFLTNGSGLGPKVSTTPVVTEKTADTNNPTDKKDDSKSSNQKTDESSKSTDSKDSSSENSDSKKSETTNSDSSSNSEKTSDSNNSNSSSENNSSNNNSATGSSNSNSGSNQNSSSGNGSSNGSNGSGSNGSNGGN